MPPRPSRTRPRSGVRPPVRRLSPCYRHPDEPITGICASCLRERLSGLDSSIAAADAPSPELRRSRSVISSSRCEASTSNEQRRKSCDVVSARSSLSNLFDVDDLRSGSDGDARVESKNVGLTSVTYTVIQSEERCEDEIRAPSHKVGELNADCAESSNKVEEEDFKTMKEYIDLEFQTRVKKSKDLREIAGNFLGAASVFTKKLKKWRQKNGKVKKLDNGCNESSIGKDNVNLKSSNAAGNVGGNHPEAMGRRSCDTEPRFSVDTGRISFEEPRASWDGYMIARTIPRLAPMFSVVEDGILGNMNRAENRRLSVDGPMHSIVEDESSSGASGSGHSNSDSSSSRRQSSFDRSSSVRSFGKKAMNSDDHGVSPANVKLVITEKELKDWRLSKSRDDDPERIGSKTKSSSSVDSSVTHSNDLATKNPIKWRRMRNLFGLKAKDGDIIDASNEKQGKLTRSSSVGLRDSNDALGLFHHSRRSVDNAEGYAFMDRNRSIRHMDSGSTPPFYMTPLRSLKNSKPGKLKLQSPHHVAGHVLQLN